MHAVKLTNSEALFDASYSPEIKVYVDGVLTAPSSATLSLFWPNGDEKITDRACTINGTTKAITPSTPFTAAERQDDVDEDYRLLLKYVVSSITYWVNLLFDDCKTPLTCSVIDDDLEALDTDISNNRPESLTTWTKYIEQAFNDIKRMLKEKGRRASMIVDASQINDLIVTHTLDLIYFYFAKNTEDIWWIKYLKMAEKFNAEFESLHIKYDLDEDGVVDEPIFFGTGSLTR